MIGHHAQFLAVLPVLIGPSSAAILGAGCAERREVAQLAIRPVDARRASGQPQSEKVHYGETVLVITAPQGVAAVGFHEPFRNGFGVHYHYRFVPTGGTNETRGAGIVWWKLQRVPSTQPDPLNDAKQLRFTATHYREDGSELFVHAGDLRFEWSVCNASSGWVYYDPGQYKIRLATAREFETLDLTSAATAATAATN